MNYHKRIILDFDDTLAFCQNRDWSNAKPNGILIQKTNKLYDEGWQIDIFTARGSISCSTREEAKKKYLAGMEEWLQRNGVKYHSISFDKPLAAYYIDDKGMTPEEFIEKKIENLQGGLSGSDIYTDGKMVHKQDKNSYAVSAWYASVKGVNIPTIDRVVGETITMSYIPHDKAFFKNNFHVALGMIQETLDALKKNDVNDELMFESYVERIAAHARASNEIIFMKIANQLPMLMNLKRSFSHGDFGITNMLFSNGKLYMVDPIPGVFGCTELDAAKFIASLYINKYDNKMIRTAMRAMSIYNEISMTTLEYLAAAEIIRVYKYHPDKQFIKQLVETILNIEGE